MSVEVLLIPIGIAAFAAWRESRSTDLCEKCKTTRITDQRLLVEALMMIGASHLHVAEGRITGQTRYGPITFQRVGEVFLGRVDKADEQTTSAMLTELERAVGSVTQAKSVARIRERAAQLGLTLVTERAQDGNVQLVFETN